LYTGLLCLTAGGGLGFAAATTYYLDCSPSNTGANTGLDATNAWKSAEMVNTHGDFLPGDKILIRRGTTVTGPGAFRTVFFHDSPISLVGVLSPLGSGSASARITLDAYGTGAKPIIDAQGGPSTAAVLLLNQQYWTVQNLEVRSRAATWQLRWGIYVLFCKDVESTVAGITIRNNTVNGVHAAMLTHYQAGGIHVKVNEPQKLDNLLIEGNQINDIIGEAICFWGENEKDGWENTMNWNRLSTKVVIRGNSIKRTSADGIVVLGTDNVLIEHNGVDNVGSLGIKDIGPFVAIWPSRHKDGLIQYNTVSNTRLIDGDGQAFDNDCYLRGTTIFQYNYTHDNEGGFFAEVNCMQSDGSGNTDYSPATSLNRTILRYNVSQNDGLKIVSPKTPFQYTLLLNRGNALIYNNVFYTRGTIRLDCMNTNTLRNNIFYGAETFTDNDPASPTYGLSCASSFIYGNTYDHNCYFGGLTPPADDFKITADPQFSNAGGGGEGLGAAQSYRLKPTSPCIDSGAALSANGGRDFFGTALYQGLPDVGACEHPRLFRHFSFNATGADATGSGAYVNPVGGSYVTDRNNWSGYAYQFNGSSDYAWQGPLSGLYSSAESNAGSVSISGWFKSSASTAYGSAMILLGVGRPVGQGSLQVGIGPKAATGKTVFRVNGWGDAYDWKTDLDPAAYFNGQWHHVAVTYLKSSKSTVLYLDGAKKASTTAFTYNIGADDASLVIGGEIDKSGWNFNGALDEIKLFAKSLSASEVSALYGQEKPTGYSADLFAHYKFNFDARDFAQYQGEAQAFCGFGADRFGAARSAAVFDGGQNHVVSAAGMNGFASGACAKTVCGWFKSDDQSGGDRMLFGFGMPLERYNFQVGLAGNYFRINGWGHSNDWPTAVSSLPYLNNAWHHCAVTYDGTTTTLYLDGVSKASTTAYTYTTDPGKSRIVIGREIDLAGWEWLGGLDEVRVYKKALSSTEVTNLYTYEKANR
jgi:hypothetical protein